MSDRRPSPEALLEQAQKEGRGRFKIFLGAAPGVGKTFEMLIQARQRRLDGVDVVIGVVETHGRVETDALTKGFETLPKKRSAYKGQMLAEMDIDAILQRRPQLVLVDELAHTNAEGSRHPKRYLDVEELLTAGIDVYTTVNIQHLESLNDVVAQITRIRVRETVPDYILQDADEIELVDTTADDLLKRLRDGKVYVKAQAERALRHFFQPGNLTALRELALRKAAQHVDRDMVDYMQAHAIGGPWPAGERVLVCVNEHASSAALVRRAKRLADDIKASWTAIFIEGPRYSSLSEQDRDRVADTLRLAQRLGAETANLPGRDIADTILTYARKNNVTQIVIGKTERSRWFELFYGSVVRSLIRDSGAISIVSVSAKGEPLGAKTVKTAARQEGRDWRPFAWSALYVALTALAANLLSTIIAGSSLGILFLVPVLLSAISFGRWPALFTAIASVLAYNFFCLPPLYSFTIADPANLISFAVLLFVAMIAGNLGARVRAQANLAAARAAVTAELYSFTGKLAAIARLDDILWAAAFQIASMLKLNVVFLLPDDKTGKLEIRAGYPPEDELDAQDMAAASWCWEKGKSAGRNSDTLPGAKRLFLPMRTGKGLVGIVGLLKEGERVFFTPDERRLLDALIDQTAIAIERAELVEKVDEAQVHAEADKLRMAMLSSLSHDLRTPLASILGAATTLAGNHALYDANQTNELLATIREESERLDRFVGNLLDMSRLEAGALKQHREPVDLEDVVDAAMRRAAPLSYGRHVEKKLASDLPPILGDTVLLEQAVFNVLDNALKYGAADRAPIVISVSRENDTLRLTIADTGPGIPADEIERIFEKFHRAEAADRRIAGTGLGLAVARGFTEAMGGTLIAANRPEGGAIFTFAFPVAKGGA